MQEDQYGKTTIRNVYYDTENYRLIRRSLGKPVYKEKLRMRSYRTAGRDSPDRAVCSREGRAVCLEDNVHQNKMPEAFRLRHLVLASFSLEA